MMSSAAPLVEINQFAIRLLCSEIGVVNTARFLNQFSNGCGNYTEERGDLLGKMSIDEIVAGIERAHTQE